MGTVKRMVNAVNQSVQKSTAWVWDAARRIFSPNDDDYPATGVQPFEGEISDTGR